MIKMLQNVGRSEKPETEICEAGKALQHLRLLSESAKQSCKMSILLQRAKFSNQILPLEKMRNSQQFLCF